ncbi:MAG: hypothetical protein JJ974_12330, partial [Phycisphaerales bacterium]|nr:hypothetical protein [Phycisphaerales bacterium]
MLRSSKYELSLLSMEGLVLNQSAARNPAEPRELTLNRSSRVKPIFPKWMNSLPTVLVIGVHALVIPLIAGVWYY